MAKLILSQKFHRQRRKENTEGDVIGDEGSSQAKAGPSWTEECLGQHAVPVNSIQPAVQPARALPLLLADDIGEREAGELDLDETRSAPPASIVYKRSCSNSGSQFSRIATQRPRSCRDMRYLARVEPEFARDLQGI